MLQFFRRHKIMMIILVVIILGGGYWYSTSSQTSSTTVQYTLSAVQRGMLIVSVSESGQAIVSNQLDIRPRASAELISIDTVEGQKVGTGSILAHLDTTDAEKTVRDAELSLQTTQLAMEKLKKPAEPNTLMQATDEVNQAKRALTDLQKPADDILQARNALAQAQRDLDQANNVGDVQTVNTTQSTAALYADGYNAVSSAFLDLTSVMSDVESFRRGDTSPIDHISEFRSLLNSNTSLDNFLIDYNTLTQLYDSTVQAFQATSRSSGQAQIYQILNSSLGLAKIMAQTLQDAQLTLDAISQRDYSDKAIAPVIAALIPKIRSDVSTMNRDITSLQGAMGKIDDAAQASPTDVQKNQNTITAAQEKLQERQAALNKLLTGPKASDVATAQERIKEKEAALTKLQQGPDTLDLQNQELTIQQRINSLNDAKVHLSDYVITAPFDGIIGKITNHVGDTLSSSTVFTTLASEQLEAQITLNEIDIASVKLGNQVTLTFDALPDLSLTGKIIQIDSIGTVSQGVVSYNARVAFDALETAIRSGMSLQATVITDSSANVLLVPSSAVKTQGTSHYVEVVDQSIIDTISTSGTSVTTTELPTRKTVVIGKTNDTQSEIVSGVNEGELVVTQTISGATPTAARTGATSSTLRIPGLTGGAGGGGFGGATRTGGATAR